MVAQVTFHECPTGPARNRADGATLTLALPVADRRDGTVAAIIWNQDDEPLAIVRHVVVISGVLPEHFEARGEQEDGRS